MRRILPGLPLMLIGSVWLLQGVGVLPGSFMTGQLFWAAVGAVCLTAGLAVVVRGLRRG